MKTATFIKNLDNFTGEAKLYKVSEPVSYSEPAKTTDFVAVSAAHCLGRP
jgi:hypothetical protein